MLKCRRCQIVTKIQRMIQNMVDTVKSLIVTALDYKPPSNSNRTFFTYGRIEIETALK